jgi:hypothetical protein
MRPYQGKRDEVKQGGRVPLIMMLDKSPNPGPAESAAGTREFVMFPLRDWSIGSA